VSVPEIIQKERTTFGDLHLDVSETGYKVCSALSRFVPTSYVLCTPETSSNHPVQVLDIT